MPRLVNTLPKYSRHKQSGQAVVYIDGRDVLLGQYGTKASREAYNRLVGEWLAAGRQLAVPNADITIVELIERFKKHAEAFYVLPVKDPDGTPALNADGSPKTVPSGEWENYRIVLQQLRLAYGRTPAKDFGPLAFKALRNRVLVEHECIGPDRKPRKVPGWARSYTNRQMGRLRHVFRWAASEEILPQSIHQSLSTVDGLRAGKSRARETEPVRPVPEATVQATLPFLSRPVKAMVELQLYSGARGGELFIMRPCDIDRSKPVWRYTPSRHKSEHKGIVREIALGERCQKILAPFLIDRSPADYCFSPAEGMAEMRAKRAAARKTPKTYGNAPGTNRKARPNREPGDVYNNRAYAHAIMRAAEKAGVPHWHPHQIRHTKATNDRREFGIEGARAVLGHTTEEMTGKYAERDWAIAERIAAQVG